MRRGSGIIAALKAEEAVLNQLLHQIEGIGAQFGDDLLGQRSGPCVDLHGDRAGQCQRFRIDICVRIIIAGTSSDAAATELLLYVFVHALCIHFEMNAGRWQPRPEAQVVSDLDRRLVRSRIVRQKRLFHEGGACRRQIHGEAGNIARQQRRF